jgi:hypothetical protein
MTRFDHLVGGCFGDTLEFTCLGDYQLGYRVFYCFQCESQMIEPAGEEVPRFYIPLPGTAKVH